MKLSARFRLAIALGALAASACSTQTPRASDGAGAGAGRSAAVLLLPGPAESRSAFTAPELAELLGAVDSLIVAAGFTVTSPIERRAFPFMETSYGAEYRHAASGTTATVHATPGALGVGLTSSAAPAATDIGQAVIADVGNRIAALARTRHPDVQIEIQPAGPQAR